MEARMQREMLMKMAEMDAPSIERPWGITTRAAASDLHFKFALPQKVAVPGQTKRYIVYS